ncbi:hypothetical protein V6N12_018581 [Hibiscus sabdariffa]|uniref:Tubby C-terminal domain-containing protein n=1 Tax=Hibiscus sabdariffa TaxID=183260 RepID=A0ABR2BYA5_9ROSI
MAIKCIARLSCRRVIQDHLLQASNEAAVGGGFCWANLPPELLWEVLLRIEDSESSWPERKNVVACAGVCRTWRIIIKQIVKVPQISGKLTFPISVKQAEDISKGRNAYVGRLRSNFLGNKFTVFDGQLPHAGAKMAKSRSSRLANLKQVSPRVPPGNYPMAHISYELNSLGSRGPRRMLCNMNTIPATSIGPGGLAPTQAEFTLSNVNPSPPIPIFHSKSASMENFLSGHLSDEKNGLVLINKAPRWHEQLQCWCLNFHGRVTVASVKNFQLVASPENRPAGAGPEHEKIILQFGKVGKDLFTMDYRYPISAFQAFAICLSSFDTNIACE